MIETIKLLMWLGVAGAALTLLLGVVAWIAAWYSRPDR